MRSEKSRLHGPIKDLCRIPDIRSDGYPEQPYRSRLSLKSTIKVRSNNGLPQEIRLISVRDDFMYGKNFQISGSEDIMATHLLK